MLNHTKEEQKIKFYGLRSEVRWRPSGSFILHGFGKYNLRQENTIADESNFEFGGSIQRFWRVFRLLFKYELRKWEYGQRHTNERRVIMEIERIF